MKTTHNVPLKALCLTLGVHFKGTSARKYKRKKYFSFVFLSLIRTFNPTDFRYSRSEKQKENEFFFGFSLA